VESAVNKNQDKNKIDGEKEKVSKLDLQKVIEAPQ
jgi:hypothetical protein